MKIKMNQISKGNVLILDNVLHKVVDFYNVKPGKGGAFAQVKLRNLDTGSQFEKRFRTEDTVEKAHLEEKTVQYLYSDGDGFHFMDSETYEQFMISADFIGESKNFMLDNMELNILFHGEKPLDVNLPLTMNLKVEYTEPGVKGDTVSGGATKPARLETGYEIQVPLFIEIDEVLKIDTRSGKYVSRAND